MTVGVLRLWRGVLLGALLLSTGCFCTARHMIAPPSPVKAGFNPVDIVDAPAEADAHQLLDASKLYQVAERIRQEQRPAVACAKRSVLVLSGGGAYGAYSAGVLVGWTQTGQRPQFDVVTGISTGALIAPLAFLGPQYDSQLQTMYTTMREQDLFRIRKSVRTLFAESLADNSPLVRKLEETVTPDLLRAIAAEHLKGRRLYVGTTELDGRRQVVWDLGAIAAHGTEADLELFRSVVLASAAIPGFFPPVRIPVEIGGKVYEERHVDGGVSAALFFRPPSVPPEKRNDPAANSLYDTDLYILVAGKLYADPEVVKPRALWIAGTSVSALLYAQTRGDLMRLYTACVLTGMNYRMTSIPMDVPLTSASTDFDPVEMSKLFQEGIRQVTSTTPWRLSPPGLERGEGVSQRSGTVLTHLGGGTVPHTESPAAPFLLVPTTPQGIPVRRDSISK